MLPAVVDAAFVGTLLVGVVLCGVGWRVRRNRAEPGVDAFAAFCFLVGGTGLFAGTYGLLMVDPRANSASGGPTSIGVWYHGLSSLLYLTPIPWGLFALQYTGRSRDLDLGAGSKAAFALVVAAVPLMGWAEYLTAVVVPVEFPSAVVVAYFLVRTVATLFSLAVYFCAGALVLYTTYVYSHLEAGQGISLTAAATLPLPAIWLAAWLLASRQFPVKVGGFVTVAACFAVPLVGVGLGLYRYDAFESTPAAGNVGRETLIEEIDDLVVVVDHNGRVAEVNPAATEVVCESKRDPLGDPVEDLLGVDVDHLRATETVELPTNGGRRQFDPQVSDLSDQHGRGYGTVVTLRDVTRREIREQRLEVLNRVLRHNLRNKLSIVKGTADIIAREGTGQEFAADRLGEAADELMELGEKAREIEQLMRQHDHEEIPVRMSVVVEDVVGGVAREYPDVRFRTDVDGDLVVRGDENLVRTVVENVVENAAEHNTADEPRVDVSVDVDVGTDVPVTIAVADNGPGIPEEERAVIQGGEETPLEHASGLGLWAVNWAVTRMGGDVAFDDSRFGGALVRIDLPRESPAHTMTVETGAMPLQASGD